MKRIQFRKIGIIHYPVTVLAWTVLVVFFGFLLNVFMAIDRNSHSVSDTLYNFSPYIISVFLLYEWIAEKSSK